MKQNGGKRMIFGQEKKIKVRAARKKVDSFYAACNNCADAYVPNLCMVGRRKYGRYDIPINISD